MTRYFSESSTQHTLTTTPLLILTMTVQLKRLDPARCFLALLETTIQACCPMALEAQDRPSGSSRRRRFNPLLDVIGLLECFGWSSVCHQLRSLLLLLSEGYAIVASLLNAELVPMTNPLVVTLCAYAHWSDSLFMTHRVKDVWTFFTALISRKYKAFKP